jgi:hypothetical protein
MSKTVSNLELSQRRKNQFKTLISENNDYPLATITYHGPNPDRATKIVVGILISKDQAPIIKSWSGDNIGDDVESAKEITHFIKEHEVARVITSEWVVSCPHEQGIDYPDGEFCPHCPDWN